MTEDQHPVSGGTSFRRDDAMSVNTSGPIVAGGAMGVLLAAALIGGGILAVNGAMTATASMAATEVAEEAPPNTDEPQESAGSDEAPSDEGLGDPTPPPDRDSDQTPDVLPSATTYTIQPGDTLTSISAQSGIGIDSLAEYNSIRDANILSEGATLVIPPADWLPVPPMVVVE